MKWFLGFDIFYFNTFILLYMKFSIIIPFFGAERFLEQTLFSIKNQTFDDFECIVVNDGSLGTDVEKWYLNQDKNFKHKYIPPKELEQKNQFKFIFENVVGEDNRFKFIEKKNNGVCKARNSGLEIATGTFLVFLDADDYIDNNYLHHFNEAIKNRKIDEPLTLFYPEVFTNIDGNYFEYSSIVKNLSKKNSLASNLVFPSRTATPIGYCWRLKQIKEAGLKFLTNEGEDTMFFFDNILELSKRNIKLNPNFVKIPATYYYRQFPNQLTKANSFQIKLFEITSTYMKNKASQFAYFGFGYVILAKLFSFRFRLYKIKLETKNIIIKVSSIVLSKILTVISLIVAACL
jgi:glycosyltransferase involved in cell wall biosynthesis